MQRITFMTQRMATAANLPAWAYVYASACQGQGEHRGVPSLPRQEAALLCGWRGICWPSRAEECQPAICWIGKMQDPGWLCGRECAQGTLWSLTECEQEQGQAGEKTKKRKFRKVWQSCLPQSCALPLVSMLISLLVMVCPSRASSTKDHFVELDDAQGTSVQEEVKLLNSVCIFSSSCMLITLSHGCDAGQLSSFADFVNIMAGGLRTHAARCGLFLICGCAELGTADIHNSMVGG